MGIASKEAKECDGLQRTLQKLRRRACGITDYWHAGIVFITKIVITVLRSQWKSIGEASRPAGGSIIFVLKLSGLLNDLQTQDVVMTLNVKDSM